MTIKWFQKVTFFILDPRVDDYPLISSPFPTLSIIAFYLYFVTNLGPKLMQDRKEFNIKIFITFYNLFQVVVNFLNVSIVSNKYFLNWKRFWFNFFPHEVLKVLTKWKFKLVLHYPAMEWWIKSITHCDNVQLRIFSIENFRPHGHGMII